MYYTLAHIPHDCIDMHDIMPAKDGWRHKQSFRRGRRFLATVHHQCKDVCEQANNKTVRDTTVRQGNSIDALANSWQYPSAARAYSLQPCPVECKLAESASQTKSCLLQAGEKDSTLISWTAWSACEWSMMGALRSVRSPL